MTLRTRLTAAFLAVVLGPVLLGAVFVGGAVAAVSRDRSVHELELAASTTRSAIAALCQQLRTTAEAVATHPKQDQAAVAAELAGRGMVTAVRIIDTSGDSVAVTDGAPPLPWAYCAGTRGGDGPVRYAAIAARASRSGVVGGPAGAGQGQAGEGGQGSGEVWAAARLDPELVDRLAAAAGTAVTLLEPTAPRLAGPVYSTDDTPGPEVEAARGLAPDEVGQSEDGRWVRRLEPSPGQPLPLVLSTPRTDLQGLYALLAAVVSAAGLLAVVTAWRLGRSTTRPLAELGRAADQLADGDLSVRVPVRGGDEAGRLAATFNRMTHRMQSYVQALTASRDQLRQHLTVLGDTLSSTHDLDRILQVILRTALAATGARYGAVLLLDQRSATLVGQATAGEEATGPARGGAGHAADRGTGEHGTAQRGTGERGTGERDAGERGTGEGGAGEAAITVPVGDGLLGAVAATGEARRGRVAADGPVLHPAEPRCRTYVVVPISAPTGLASYAAPWPAPPTVRGVLALYDRLGADDFDDSDLDMLRTFASQAGVAVDNVRTHQEAQRLSLTDPLTGLWNYRNLKGSTRREVERASRFAHTLAVLTLDLDRFKDVNDAYGHAAGDAVLVEFACRIQSVIRGVDQAFRQGGEEFVVLLPETDARGATVLAQRLGAAVRDEPVAIAPRGGAGGPLSIRVTVSIGIAVYPEHALAPQALLDAADEALYAAKAAGRDTYRVATAGPAPVAASELPVRARARIPDDDLPQAGGGSGGSPGGTAGGAAGGDRPPSGGAQPPRQTRGR